MIVRLFEKNWDEENDRPSQRALYINVKHVLFFQKFSDSDFTLLVMCDKSEFEIIEDPETIQDLINKAGARNGI